jgi:hypothetical protein
MSKKVGRVPQTAQKRSLVNPAKRAAISNKYLEYDVNYNQVDIRVGKGVLSFNGIVSRDKQLKGIYD